VDRAEVDQRLASDAGLRDLLEHVRMMQQTVWAGLARLDDKSRLPVAPELTVQRMGGLMRQWQLDRMRATAANGNGQAHKVPWLRYSAAATAMLLIGLVAWWGFGPPQSESDHVDVPEVRMELAEVFPKTEQAQDPDHP